MNARRGFSVVELLVALLVTLVLSAGLFSIVAGSEGAFRVQPEAAEMQQRLRAAGELLTSALLEAGSGPSAPALDVPLGAVVPSVLPYRIGGRGADPPGTFRTDIVSVVRAQPGLGTPALATEMAAGSWTASVGPGPGCSPADAGCGLQAGMTVLVVRPRGDADLLGIAAVSGASVSFESRGPSSGRRFPMGSLVVPVLVDVFHLAPASASEGPRVMRYDGDLSDLPAIDHVVSMSFEYFGDPQPPRIRGEPGAGWPVTYGPAPPMLGEDDESEAWAAGENCTFAVTAGVQQSRLSAGNTALLALDAGSLTDGPWCPDGAAAARYDADVLRVRKIRVTLRVEAGSDGLRGQSAALFTRPGTAHEFPNQVPDRQVAFDVVPRSLSLGR
jgi:hypothetical protein